MINANPRLVSSNKWNSYVDYYRNTRKTSKKNVNYKYDNDKQSLTTKENENTECQKARTGLKIKDKNVKSPFCDQL